MKFREITLRAPAEPCSCGRMSWILFNVAVDEFGRAVVWKCGQCDLKRSFDLDAPADDGEEEVEPA